MDTFEYSCMMGMLFDGILLGAFLEHELLPYSLNGWYELLPCWRLVYYSLPGVFLEHELLPYSLYGVV